MFDYKKAEAIAKDFLNKQNPTMWDGTGEMPDDFDARIVSYDIDSINGNRLDISMEWQPDSNTWEHYCEVVDDNTNDLLIPLHGYGINSIQNLIDTIMEVCMNEN